MVTLLLKEQVSLAGWNSYARPLYCRVPEGRGLQQTASPPSRDETRSVNPLVRKQVD